MNLHNEIMNIQDDPEQHMFRHSHALAYKIGHKDARHAAAELSLKYEALIERLLDALDNHNAVDFVDNIREEFALHV